MLNPVKVNKNARAMPMGGGGGGVFQMGGASFLSGGGGGGGGFAFSKDGGGGGGPPSPMPPTMGTPGFSAGISPLGGFISPFPTFV